MSKNNENNPSSVTIQLGKLDETKDFPLTHLSKKSRIVSAVLVNGSAVNPSDNAYVVVQIKNGDKVVASLDTRPGEGKQGPIMANQAKAMAVQGGQETQPGKSDLVAHVEVAGTTLTDAVLVLTYHPL